VNLYDWLLFFHVTGAFLLIGGIVIAGILNLVVIMKDRPLASVLGNVDGKYQRQTGELARRLAAEGDAPSSELRARLRNPRALAISYASGLMAFAVLGIMIWKPGV
jgi:hypothetical protein